MPLLQIQTSAGAEPPALLQALSGLLARELGKPERYVMVTYQGGVAITFGGSTAPACFAALKNIGTFTPSQTEHLSAVLTEQLAGTLGIARDRIYIEFVNAQEHLWGYDGGTFA